MKKFTVLSSLLLASLAIGSRQTFAASPDTKDQKASVSLVESTEPGVSLLEITSASDLSFGSQAIGIGDINFKESNSPNIVITDIRGNAPGWSLAVSLGEFKEADSNQTLKGVQLFYPTVEMTTNATVNAKERTPQTTATDSSFSDSSIKGLLLDASSTATSKTLINATSGKGNGQWTATYNSENKVELKVSAGNLAGNYTADLTYRLTDGPTE